MSCINKNLDSLCNKFVSLNINLSPTGGPTIDCELIGEPNGNPVEVASGIVNELNNLDLPIPLGPWVVTSIKTAKSSSGIVTSVRAVDSVWLDYNSKLLGVQGSSGGDVILGEEYFHIQGIPVGKNLGRGEIIIKGDLLRQYYRNFNNGTKYINADGNIVSQSSLSAKQFLESYSYSLPNPFIEFGSFYYKFEDLIKETKVNNASGIYGLYNESGSFFDVLSSIGASFGKLFVANSMYGATFVDLASNIGKLEVLENAGISVPESAVNSAKEIDFASGYTIEATRINKMPGRYKNQSDLDDDIDSDDGRAISDTNRNGSKFCSVEQYTNSQGSSRGGIVDASKIYRRDKQYDEYEWKKSDLAWAIFKQTNLGKEYCAAANIKKRVLDDIGTKPVDQDFYKEIHDKETIRDNDNQNVAVHYEVYTGFGEDIDLEQWDNAAYYLDQPQKDAEESLTSEDETIDYSNECLQYHLDYNRFQFCTHFYNESGRRSPQYGNGALLASGTKNADQYGNSVLNHCPFSNFGSRYFNLGSKQWWAEGGAGVNFIECSTSLSQTPFAPAKSEDKTNIAQFFDMTNVDFDEQQGVIILDFGQNPMPDFNFDYDLDGVENFIDMGSPVHVNGESTSGVAFIRWDGTGGLLKRARDTLSSLENTIDDMIGSNPSRPVKLGYSGMKSMDISGMGHRSGDGRFGDSLYDNKTEEDQIDNINPEIKAIRKYNSTTCINHTNEGTGAEKLNRKHFNSIVDYAWTEGVLNAETKKYNQLPVRYLDADGKSEVYGYNDLCSNANSVPYLQKISFTLINELYTNFDPKYLESLSVNIIDGKVIASYTFSEKSLLPDYKGMNAMKVKMQNSIR
jgi:hypothetical protein